VNSLTKLEKQLVPMLNIERQSLCEIDFDNEEIQSGNERVIAYAN